MCFKTDWEESSALRVNNWAIHSIVEDSDLYKSPQYNKDVRILPRLAEYLHYPVSWNWGTAVSSIEEDGQYQPDHSGFARKQGRLLYEADMLSRQVASHTSDHPSRYQALEYCSSWRTF